MLDGNLGTTNVLIGVLAVVSVLEALVFIAVGIAVFRLLSQVQKTVHELQSQVAPVADRLDKLASEAESTLADVKTLTSQAVAGVQRAGSALQTAAGVMDVAGHAARHSLGRRAQTLIGVAKGLRVAYRILAGVGTGRARPEGQSDRRSGAGEASSDPAA